MSFKSILRGIAPIAAIAIAAAASASDGKVQFSCDGEEAKKLSELDLSGEAPTELCLLGPDTVHISTGDSLAITVEGDEDIAAGLRFALNDGRLSILRKGGRESGDGTVTVKVVMPAPTKLTMAGSGKIVADSLDGERARVTVAGSGAVETDRVETDSLKVEIAGSGSYRASGNARALKLTIAGSGDARLDALKVEDAKIDIAGSGDSAFASDGTVRATIMGSGEIRVFGRATCKVNSMGSGRLVCEPSASAEAQPGEKASKPERKGKNGKKGKA